MIHFNRLRLSGFKSFVDPVLVPIEPGLTGIVGPNGCGKSNLIDALIWVMGEHTARLVRGTEMDDVIFGGAAGRPSRNLAEVSLQLDNRDHQAPHPFTEIDEIEVTRRIDRGMGSDYRINGKSVRARDVQTLFADAASGAHSTAIISQGRIGDIISAKPADRRQLLEDAAGIAGLHARRHEAELRLRAAETNLARLEDVANALDGQLAGLKKQARQAARYRSISQRIRDAEGIVLGARWLGAQAGLEAALAALEQSERDVVSLTAAAAAAGASQVETAALVPGLRETEAKAALAQQRLLVQREQIEEEAARLTALRQDIERRLTQIESDLALETRHLADSQSALTRLAEEASTLGAARDREAEERILVEAEAAAAGEQVAAIEAEVGRAVAALAQAEAESASRMRAQAEADARRDRLAKRAEDVAAQLAQLAANAIDDSQSAALGREIEQDEVNLQRLRTDIATQETALAAAQDSREQALRALQTETGRRAGLAAEAKALADLLAQAAQAGQKPVLDDVSVEAGWETALDAALGEDLSAPLDRDSAVAWRELPPLAVSPPLPEGAEALKSVVTAPGALARRLSQIGLVSETAEGDRLQASLRPGQRLVSRAGDMWRWDGFTIHAGAPGAAAARLRQKNRLREVETLLADIEQIVVRAESEAKQSAAAAETQAAIVRQSRQDMQRGEAELARKRRDQARLVEQLNAQRSRLAGLSEQDSAIRAELAAAEAEAVRAAALVAEIADFAGLQQLVARLRADLAAAVDRLAASRGTLGRLRHESESRGMRLVSLAAEQASWQARAEAAERQHASLTGRRDQDRLEAARLASQPAEIDARRHALLAEIAAAEAERRRAASLLTDAEQNAAAADRALKAAERTLAEAREERIRREAASANAAEAVRTLMAAIAERMDCEPAALLERIGEITADGAAEAERRLDRLLRERDTMGPVNLRAETEAAELEEKLTELHRERDDLVAAIAKLRQAIGEINREGRERLRASFAEVDKHFRALFARLFNGGSAALNLTEAEDPLEAGLEIVASPPGKKLQTLSLLSGGEQALTAMALLFAMFLANPAPICVLDEVDAPLDDANVDRVCTLLAEIEKASGTRFLVVTHHPITMAKMDRLFGVTMAERGISTLVSVDLTAAETLRERA